MNVTVHHEQKGPALSCFAALSMTNGYSQSWPRAGLFVKLPRSTLLRAATSAHFALRKAHCDEATLFRGSVSGRENNKKTGKRFKVVFSGLRTTGERKESAVVPQDHDPCVKPLYVSPRTSPTWLSPV
jgi:hypothetical protein